MYENKLSANASFDPNCEKLRKEGLRWEKTALIQFKYNNNLMCIKKKKLGLIELERIQLGGEIIPFNDSSRENGLCTG